MWHFANDFKHRQIIYCWKGSDCTMRGRSLKNMQVGRRFGYGLIKHLEPSWLAVESQRSNGQIAGKSFEKPPASQLASQRMTANCGEKRRKKNRRREREREGERERDCYLGERNEESGRSEVNTPLGEFWGVEGKIKGKKKERKRKEKSNIFADFG